MEEYLRSKVQTIDGHLAIGSLSQAKDMIDSIFAENSNEKDPRFLNCVGIYYTAIQEFNIALEWFNKIKINSIDDADLKKRVIRKKIDALRKIGQFHESLALITTINQHDYQVQSLKGFILSDLNKLEEAIECFEKAIELKPDCKEAKQGLGNAYRDMNNEQKAFECYKKYYEHRESENKTLLIKIQLHMHFFQYREAFGVALRLLDRDPVNYDYLKSRICLLFHLGNFDACISEGRKLLGEEDNIIAYNNIPSSLYFLYLPIAVSYHRISDYKNYAIYMKKYEDKTPDDKRIPQYFIEKAREKAQCKYEEGMQILDKILEKKPYHLPAIILKLEFIMNNDRDYETNEFYKNNQEYATKYQIANREQTTVNSTLMNSIISGHSIYDVNNFISINSNSKTIQLQKKIDYSVMGYKDINQLSINLGDNNQFNSPSSFQNVLDNDELLGQGGCGKVILHEFPGGQKCAFKQINSSNKLDYNEQRILSNLNHPNIVKLKGIFDNNIIMEYCPGKDLFNVLIMREVKVPMKYKLRIIRQIAEAIEHIHNNQIIHGDIKNQNILLMKPYDPQEYPVPKLCDFGLSKMIKDSLSARAAGYSLLYASPEVFTKEMIITSESDIYSFGMTIFEIITQTIPYAKETQEKKIEFLKRGIHPNFDLIEASQDLINLMKLMCKQLPKERPKIQDIVSKLKAIEEQY